MEIEYAAISAVLKNPRILGRAEIDSHNFTDPSCRAIWEAIESVSRHSPVDIVTVADHLSQATGKEWVRTIGQIANSPSSPANIETYCAKIKHHSIQAKGREICINAAHSDGDIDVSKIMSELMALTRESKSSVMSIKQTLQSSFVDIEAAFDRQGMPGIPTGFPVIDDVLGGFQNSDLIVIAGRPAMGKTAFLVSLIATCEARGFFVSGEMAHRQVGNRLISQVSSVPSTNLRNGKIKESDWPKLSASVQSLSKQECWIYDKPNPNITDVIQQARMAKHEHDIEIMYVDYLQKIRSPGKSSRVEEIEDVVMALKDTARELDIPVISLAQVNRQCEQRPDRRPMMSDLKGAGGIEQEADAVGFLYRDCVYNDGADETAAELLWEKNRHGPTGAMNIHFDPKTIKFSDYSQVVPTYPKY